LALEEVATEAEVTLEMSDAWFDGCSSTEAGTSLSFLIRRGALFGNSRSHECGFTPMGSSPIASFTPVFTILAASLVSVGKVMFFS
jgi:hypothetical protein